MYNKHKVVIYIIFSYVTGPWEANFKILFSFMYTKPHFLAYKILIVWQMGCVVGGNLNFYSWTCFSSSIVTNREAGDFVMM